LDGSSQREGSVGYFPKFTPIEINAVEPGTFCGFIHGAHLHFGIAVKYVDGVRSTFVSVSPGSSAYGHRVGVSAAIGPAIIFSNPRVRLAFGSGAPRTGRPTHEIAGALVLVDGKLGIAALIEARLGWLFNLENGERMERNEQLHPYFPSWSVETKDDDGTWTTLCEFNFDK
jgi:hypothetical protein